MKAPDFTLLDQDGIGHSLSNHRGSWVVLFFYPKDDTPGCTIEACQFRDVITDFKAHNAQVFGISKDTVKSHAKFAGKHALEFPLLSDPSTEMIQAYNVWRQKKFMGREFMGIVRETILVNPQGEIAKRYEGVDPLVHAAEVLQDVKTLSAS